MYVWPPRSDLARAVDVYKLPMSAWLTTRTQQLLNLEYVFYFVGMYLTQLGGDVQGGGCDRNLRLAPGISVRKILVSGNSVTRQPMPTVLRTEPYRVYWFSNEGREPPHVHIDRGDLSAKFWLVPLQLARNTGFSGVELRRISVIIQREESYLVRRWNEYFRS